MSLVAVLSVGVAGVSAGLAVMFWRSLRTRDAELVEARARHAADADALRAANDLAAGRQTRFEVAQAETQAAEKREQELRERLKTLGGELAQLQERLSQARETASSAQEQIKAQAEQLRAQKEFVAEASKQLTMEVENVTTKVLKERSEELRQQQERSVASLVDPVRQDLKSFRDRIDQVNREQGEGRASLEGSIRSVLQVSRAVTEQAENLAKALVSNSKRQGDFGELILSNLLRTSGLEEGRDFRLQVHVRADAQESERQRPDAVLLLPDDHHLVIDSKMSLTAWHEYVNATEAAERDAAYARHVASVSKHIDDLKAANYSSSPDLNAVDMTLMFIPIEPAGLEVMRTHPEMLVNAARSHVCLVTPSTLAPVVRLVQNSWALYNRQQSVEAIAEQGRKIHDKLANFLGTFSELGARIERAQKSFETAKAQLATGPGNAIKLASEMPSLGVVPKKAIPKEFQQTEDLALEGVDEDDEDQHPAE